MEVPQRPQPASFTLVLPKSVSSAPFGAVQKVSKKDPVKEKLQEKRDGTTMNDQTGAETFSKEEESEVSVVVEAATETSELVDSNASTMNSKPFAQDSFSEDCLISEERLAQEAEEAKRKSEEEKAAAKERAAQRQVFAIEELVQSERNYLRLLQVSTVSIRSSLQKLQVWMQNSKGKTRHLNSYIHNYLLEIKKAFWGSFQAQENNWL